MTYFVEFNNQIIMAEDDYNKLENSLIFCPECKNLPIQETEKEIVYVDGKFFYKEDVLDVLEQKQKEQRKLDILEQISELDTKRIRAVCEPSLKDENTTWLEFYNQQIKALREEYSSL